MTKRQIFTNITPLPAKITRELAVEMLHNHKEMIELNPLVIEHHPIKAPRDAPADEFLDCVWQEMTDRISYLPGGLVRGKVSYKACFHDTPTGLQTHIYAPLGLDIREKWSVGGTLPGEPPEAREMGVDLPREGLYIREDGDVRCNIMMASFVRKNLDHAHKVLVERLLKKAERIDDYRAANDNRLSTMTSVSSMNPPLSPNAVQPGSVMSRSSFIQSPKTNPEFGSFVPYQDGPGPNPAEHPAFRSFDDPNRRSFQSSPALQAQQQRQPYYGGDVTRVPSAPRQFMAELPGSTYHINSLPPESSETSGNRNSLRSELSGSDAMKGMASPKQSDADSEYSDATGQYKYNPQDYAGTSQSAMDAQRGASEMPTPEMRQSRFSQRQR